MSLMLVLAPVGAGTNSAALRLAPEPKTTCCPPDEAVHCAARCCQLSNAPAEPEPVSVPVAPVPSRTALDWSASLSVLWVLPLLEPAVAGSAALVETTTVPLTSVPLFLRHAALLI